MRWMQLGYYLRLWEGDEKMASPTINEELLNQIVWLLEEPKTVQQLESATGFSNRTIFRYLTLIKERNYDIKKAGIHRPTEYIID